MSRSYFLNTAIDCAREALRQGAAEVTMITVEGNAKEMPASPEDLHIQARHFRVGLSRTALRACR